MISAKRELIFMCRVGDRKNVSVYYVAKTLSMEFHCANIISSEELQELCAHLAFRIRDMQMEKNNVE